MRSYWDAAPKDVGTTVTTSDPAALGCSDCSVVYSRATPALTREDAAIFTFHIAKIVGGALYSRLTVADQTAAETPILAFLTYWAGVTSSTHTADLLRWHDRGADRTLVGPATRINDINIVGSASQPLPYQMSQTATWRTSSRHHWGRIYLPGLSYAAIGTTGRMATANVDGIANNLRTMYASLDALSMALGVWSQGKQAFITLTGISVDDICDVQRRRRPKQAAYHKIIVS